MTLESSIRARLEKRPLLLMAHAVVGYPGGRCIVRYYGTGKLTREPSVYCPEFGVRRESSALVFATQGARIETSFRIEP